MTGANRPRVSILIPNFNNGRQSSRTGQRDLIGDLLQSLQDTLADDPTAFEIIAYDDGSTDDSLDTLRDWSTRTWPNGRPFLELIEAEHCGILAKTANILSRRAQGELLVRLDGDIICLTLNWVTKLCEVFDAGLPRLGIVGPKQLRLDGRIHAFGDWIMHPNGYTHIATGLDRYAIRHSMEVDHVMGCFYCCKKQVFDELDGYDENFLRGQTIDFGLRARLKGWSCIAVPHIEFIHAHGERQGRKTQADSRDGVMQALKTFEDKWGFSRIAPDLDEVRRRYAGTPLLWNARWFGQPSGDWSVEPPPQATNQPIQIQNTDWARYANDPGFKQAIDLRVAVAVDVVRQTSKPRLAAVVGCGVGLLPHLLALQGLTAVGTDRHRVHVEFARQCVANQKYAGPAPRYEHQTDPRRLPLSDAEADLLLLFDQLERHHNPVGLLREAARVLEPGKLMAIVSRRKPAREQAATDPEHRYHFGQLVTQVQAVGGWGLMSDPTRDDPSRDMILIAKRLPEAAAVQMPDEAPTMRRGQRDGKAALTASDAVR
ncbi:MAG: methyltransferase domain-containing protein [Phycisphaeraceae bacterium]